MTIIKMLFIVLITRFNGNRGSLITNVRKITSPAFTRPLPTASLSSRTEQNFPRPHSITRQSTFQQPEAAMTTNSPTSCDPFKVNILVLPLPELETLLKLWDFPSFRARQIHNWIFSKGVNDFEQMTNLPSKLRALLKERTTIGSLHLELEQVSVDGTKKRAYRLHDGQLIESVLMPYEDGRRTACVSSQAGCAMGCVFCATGQMGFARQLTSDEIFEQVARFANELKEKGERLSNVVMMGMGEPLANYRNVLAAIRRMNTDLGIGARKITISTVGVVPNMKKLIEEDLPVRLALSLHCATDEERSALLPANRRYGGLNELMSTIRDYIRIKKSRVTFEWALIEGQNDSKEVARSLGRMLRKHDIRPDMIHVNLIPLNPTGGYGGSPSGKGNVQNFVEVLDTEFGISATPRMRRGIDIDAGCGQLKSSIKKKEDANLLTAVKNNAVPIVGVYEDDDTVHCNIQHPKQRLDFSFDNKSIGFHAEDDSDHSHEKKKEISETKRLIALVRRSSVNLAKIEEKISSKEFFPCATNEPSRLQPTSTSVRDDNPKGEAKRRRKTLMRNLKVIQKLKEVEASGKELSEEQQEKVAKEFEWALELESVEHNLI